MQQWEKVFWVIIIIIIVVQVYVELSWQPCFSGSKSCSSVWDWEPKPGDESIDLVHRIENANEAPKHIVKRGLVIISSLVISLVIGLYVYRKLPKPSDFTVLFFIMFGLMWVMFRWYESHYTNIISHRSANSIQELKYRLEIEKRPNI